jgi:membrane fusion protein, multidrug efflux system
MLAPLALAGCNKKENAYVAPPPAEVGVMHPITRMFAPYIGSTGTVVAYNQVTVEARVQGFVQQIAYTDGEQVKAGQLLFLVEPAPTKHSSSRRRERSLPTKRNTYTTPCNTAASSR